MLMVARCRQSLLLRERPKNVSKHTTSKPDLRTPFTRSRRRLGWLICLERNHFLKHCGEERPHLIILDSHSTHETLGLLDAARETGIELLALPPHTSQWLCPMNKTVFRPLSRSYNETCSLFMS